VVRGVGTVVVCLLRVQLVGPFLFTLTFSYFIGASAPLHLPGAPFLLAAALMVICVAIAMRTLAATKPAP